MTTDNDRAMVAAFMTTMPRRRSVACNPIDEPVVTVAAARLVEQGFAEPQIQASAAVPVGQLYLVDVDVFPLPAVRP